MDGEGEMIQKLLDKVTPGGASGGSDENPQDYKLPGAPDAPAAKRKSFREEIWEKRGAKPKDPYVYQRLSDKDDIPMSEFPKENSGLPPPEGTAETSFIKG